MDTGTKISGLAHAGMIGAALLGGILDSAPPPLKVRDVSVVTAEQFAALTAAQEPPQTALDVVAPALPEPDPDSLDVSAAPSAEDPLDRAPPQAADAPEPEQTPHPVLPAPPIADAPETTPSIEPSHEVERPLPPVAVDHPLPRPAEQIAPPPDTRIDETPTPGPPLDSGTIPRQQPEEATAPEEATGRTAPEIAPATEDRANLAPAASVRPPSRRPSPPATAEAPATDSQRDAVMAALSEALSTEETAPPAPAPSGPPLTDGEKSDLIQAVSPCWNLGSLSIEARKTTVIVSVQMTAEARPVQSSIALISSSGGSESAADQAFQAARRAIIRCGWDGYGLPADRYQEWRKIEMTFNPERMQLR